MPNFSNINNSPEQSLIQSLIEESINTMGFSIYYLPRTNSNVSNVFREATLETFTQAFAINAYLTDVYGFTGDGKFLSKFGLEIRDEVTFAIGRNSFTTVTGMVRPNEGDLIYCPLDNKMYQIKFTDHQALFYAAGKLYHYNLVCELMEYSGETFATGISTIDTLYADVAKVENEIPYLILDSAGNVIEDGDGDMLGAAEFDQLTDAMIDAQNNEFKAEADPMIDFNMSDPFGDNF